MTVEQAKELNITILDRMPKNGHILKGAMSAPNGYVWISNGKSRFSSKYKHALVKNKGDI